MSPLIGFATKLARHLDVSGIFQYAWLEGAMEARIAYLHDMPDWNNPERWPRGRIFGDTGEYRWQRNPDKTIHAVLVLEVSPLPGGFEGFEIKKDGKDSPMILWGDWVDPQKDSEGNPEGGPLFYARDIPKIQSYPILAEEARLPGRTPRIIIRRYRHETKGEFVRCVRLSMETESEEEAEP